MCGGIDFGKLLNYKDYMEVKIKNYKILIDKESLDFVKDYNWQISKNPEKRIRTIPQEYITYEENFIKKLKEKINE